MLKNNLVYTPIIGLEIHIELKTKSKMFCGCSADYFGHEPNTHCCPVCLGLPGALPVPNKKAVNWTLIAGLALNCQIPEISKFDRKSYFYPDLPKGYQISQYDKPLCVNGFLKININRSIKKIRIRRVHLEEDTGKLIHGEVGGKKYTLIDFNRSGVPLMEIVTEPDIRSSQEAKVFLQKLQQIVRYLGISDCDMEKGSMRCEPNISVLKMKNGNQELKIEELPRYKVEIKNINSFKFVEKAISYEIERQKELLEKGAMVRQETRGFDPQKGVTVPQRGKEEAQDYRYFPEPDIPPMRFAQSQISNIKSQIPELPDAKLARFMKEYGLSEYDANILTTSLPSADYFEEAARIGSKRHLTPKQIANVLINRKLNLEVPPAQFIEVILQKTQGPTIAEEELEGVVKKVLVDNSKAVSDYKSGKLEALMFLVGQVMRETKGQVNPQEVAPKVIALIDKE